ncbi:hypothetical protein KW431_14155 [Vibrio fluvialis]|nr:hypothetical protein [Vibrio fluvialis]MBY8066948.1 hypothetical protein [Vibrio fluvialis]
MRTNKLLCEKGGAMNFTVKQKSLVYDSAVCLKRALVECKDPVANELLAGELGKILVSVIDGDAKYPITCIPHFDQMTRDWLPEIEDEYFNFYSFARYGRPAFE